MTHDEAVKLLREQAVATRTVGLRGVAKKNDAIADVLEAWARAWDQLRAMAVEDERHCRPLCPPDDIDPLDPRNRP